MSSGTASASKELEVVGLMNVQFALMGRSVYVLEVSEASRTIHLYQRHRRSLVRPGRCLVSPRDVGLHSEPVARHVAV